MINKISIVEKVHRTNNFFVERILPDIGTIHVLKGEKVEPFTKMGEAKVSYFFEKIDPSFTLIREVNSYIEKGVCIGFKKKGHFKIARLYAPYSGFIRAVGDGSFIFEQDKEVFPLLSGAWGEVFDIVENKSVLILGSATIVYCAVSTPFEAEGELVVLPNPTELLEDPYFNKFTKDIAGKIIYSGYFIKLENLKKAINLGVRGIIAGGVDKRSFDYAQKNGFVLASLNGYGRIPTPDSIFAFLSSVSNRYIFIRGEKGEILIPGGEKFDTKMADRSKDYFTEIKNGMIVQVLDRPYFGWMGVVKSVEGDKVEVVLDNAVETVAVKSTNLLALLF